MGLVLLQFPLCQHLWYLLPLEYILLWRHVHSSCNWADLAATPTRHNTIHSGSFTVRYLDSSVLRIIRHRGLGILVRTEHWREHVLCFVVEEGASSDGI